MSKINSTIKKGLPNLLSVSQVAELLNIHPETLRRWDNRGLLKSLRIGSRKDRKYKKKAILQILKVGLLTKNE